MNVRVEYEATPIRHIAVQCDKCGKWFDGRDIADKEIHYEYDIYSTSFICPICDHFFGADAYRGYSNVKIKECDSASEVYDGILRKKEVWE